MTRPRLARGRENLQVVAEATVSSLQVVGRRVERVVYERGGQMYEAVGDQVVLSAGVYHSPQILMLSGVGPIMELKRLGIPVVHPLEGVGENYQDHASISMTFEGMTEFRPEWVVPRFQLMIKSDPSLPCGNSHIFMRPPTEVAGLKRMMPITAHLLEQRARGRVRLASADPRELPHIEDAMLEHPDDIEAITSIMQFVDDLVHQAPLKAFYGPLIQPGPKDDWGAFARDTKSSYHHGAGTCLMGPPSDPLAVVDHRLRIHGLDNLRVADAAIMPTVTHANTNLTCIMIGERLADFIKEEA
ncbi:MAG: hypothetical protein GEU73_00305 [Chloroflexi bacterium]|nr:hypothetical protein [Chloroflexota bacterium]